MRNWPPPNELAKEERFASIPRSLIMNKNVQPALFSKLSSAAKSVLPALLVRSDGKVSDVGLRRLAKDIGGSTDTVRRGLKELQKRDLVARQRSPLRRDGKRTVLHSQFKRPRKYAKFHRMIVTGGVWSMMTPADRAAYLVLLQGFNEQHFRNWQHEMMKPGHDSRGREQPSLYRHPRTPEQFYWPLLSGTLECRPSQDLRNRFPTVSLRPKDGKSIIIRHVAALAGISRNSVKTSLWRLAALGLACVLPPDETEKRYQVLLAPREMILEHMLSWGGPRRRTFAQLDVGSRAKEMRDFRKQLKGIKN